MKSIPENVALSDIQSITEKVNNNVASALYLVANVQVDDVFVDGAFDYFDLDKYKTYPGAEDFVDTDHIMFEVLGDFGEPIAEILPDGSIDWTDFDNDAELEVANMSDAIKKEFANL